MIFVRITQSRTYAHAKLRRSIPNYPTHSTLFLHFVKLPPFTQSRLRRLVLIPILNEVDLLH